MIQVLTYTVELSDLFIFILFSTVPISEVKAVRDYHTSESSHLSFNKDDVIIVYSKDAGSDESLWGGRVSKLRIVTLACFSLSI